MQEIRTKTLPPSAPNEVVWATQMLRTAALTGRATMPNQGLDAQKARQMLIKQNLVDEDLRITEHGKEVAAVDAYWRKDAVALVPVVPRPRRWSPSRSRAHRVFPDNAKLRHRILIEMQGPHTVNEDHQISSPGLTDWYVAEYCRLNNLKRS